jgi:hypothetical protein
MAVRGQVPLVHKTVPAAINLQGRKTGRHRKTAHRVPPEIVLEEIASRGSGSVGLDVTAEFVLHGLSPWGKGYPPLPGDKANGCLGLAAIMIAKFGQIKELSLNLGKQKVYG